MDEKFVEMADAITRAEVDAGIAAARQVEKTPPDWDGKSCIDCAEPIGAERLRLTQSCRCITCAELEERRRRMHR